MGQRYLEIDSPAGKMTLRIMKEDAHSFTVEGRFKDCLGGLFVGSSFETRTLQKNHLTYKVIDHEGRAVS